MMKAVLTFLSLFGLGLFVLAEETGCYVEDIYDPADEWGGK